MNKLRIIHETAIEMVIMCVLIMITVVLIIHKESQKQ